MMLVAMKGLSISLAALLLAACTVGPDYRRPPDTELGTPAIWQAALPHGGSLTGLSAWWEHFDDPTLVRLVEAAEDGSPTLASAVGRVREARASMISSRALLWPSVNGSGSLARGKNTSGPAETAGSGTATVTSGSADASWELDLFGGRRRGVQVAKARIESQEAEWHDARVTLAAEVASAYCSARYSQGLIEVYKQEVYSRQTSERLVSIKVREGSAPAADTWSVAASTAEAADLLEYQRGLFAQTINQIVMLTGLSYAEVQSVLSTPAAIPQHTTCIELVVPAKAVSQRPDVRVSERRLAASSAEIGVATAEALPSLSLVGSIGVNTTESGGSSTTLHTWSFGPAISIPIFNSGANAARVEAARARYDQALADYRSSVLTAVREIEDALVRIDTVVHRSRYAHQAAEHYEAYLAATELSYREGKSSLLELEDSRRQSLGANEALLGVQLEQAQSWIALYKALGGGWPVTDDAGMPKVTTRIPFNETKQFALSLSACAMRRSASGWL